MNANIVYIYRADHEAYKIVLFVVHAMVSPETSMEVYNILDNPASWHVNCPIRTLKSHQLDVPSYLIYLKIIVYFRIILALQLLSTLHVALSGSMCRYLLVMSWQYLLFHLMIAHDLLVCMQSACKDELMN